MAGNATPGRGTLGVGRGGVECAGGTAGGLLWVARAALGVDADEVAEAAGCGTGLVTAIESGGLDPVLDTVERLVNSLGLEVRAGSGGEPGSGSIEATVSEVARVRRAFLELVEFRRAHGLRPPGPPSGVQPGWDGTDPAPPRLFGAGPTRRDGGGWAAILVGTARQRSGMSQSDLASATGMTRASVAAIEDGLTRPPVSELERVLSATGCALRARLEPYDDHDDGLHLRALADPVRYARRLRNGEAAFATAVVLD